MTTDLAESRVQWTRCGSGYRGTVGGLVLFTVSWIGSATGAYRLISSLPGYGGRALARGELEKVQRIAEQALQRFVTVVGASFGEVPQEPVEVTRDEVAH